MINMVKHNPVFREHTPNNLLVLTSISCSFIAKNHVITRQNCVHITRQISSIKQFFLHIQVATKIKYLEIKPQPDQE